MSDLIEDGARASYEAGHRWMAEHVTGPYNYVSFDDANEQVKARERACAVAAIGVALRVRVAEIERLERERNEARLERADAIADRDMALRLLDGISAPSQEE